MRTSTTTYLIQEDQWLFLLRNKKENDINANKYIGVGGKLEEGETPRQCAIREIQEETGFIVDEINYCGYLDFYYAHDEMERIYVYTTSQFHGTLNDCDEGTLVWVPKEEILNLPLWEGDRYFLKRLIENDQDEFAYQFVYDENGNLLSALEVEGGQHE